MQIQIRDSSEFHSLLLALVDELVDAHIHFRLFKSLNADIPEYVRVFNQSCAFWQLTLRAHLDAVFLRLCKAYDQYGGGNPSLNLRNLLDTVAANLYLFDEPNFRERLRDNPFVDSLAATSRRPDLAQLQQDLLSVSSSDPLVNKLTIWRNNFYAHRSPAQILDAEVFARTYPLPLEDIEGLLNNGITIVNRYSDLFVATRHLPSMVGQNDYSWLLKVAKEELDRRERSFQEEVKQFI